MRNPAVLAICDRTSWGFALCAIAAYLVAGIAESTLAWTFVAVAAGALIGVRAIRRRFE